MLIPRTLSEKLRGTGLPMLFIHTPKCGGKLLGKAFGPYLKRCISLTAPELSGHLTYIEYRDRLRDMGREISDFHTLSLVRNPFDWHTSWYSYVRRNKGTRTGYPLEHDLFQKMSFDDYVDWLEDPEAPRSPQFAMGKQLLEWSCDETHEIKTDSLLRQESLLRDVQNLKDHLSLRIHISNKPVNTSKSKDYRSFYSDHSAEVIARRHAEDCRLFGYTFDGPVTPAAS